MGDPEQKAMELMAQAEKKLKSSGGFFGNLMRYGFGTTKYHKGPQRIAQHAPVQCTMQVIMTIQIRELVSVSTRSFAAGAAACSHAP